MRFWGEGFRVRGSRSSSGCCRRRVPLISPCSCTAKPRTSRSLNPILSQHHKHLKLKMPKLRRPAAPKTPPKSPPAKRSPDFAVLCWRFPLVRAVGCCLELVTSMFPGTLEAVCITAVHWIRARGLESCCSCWSHLLQSVCCLHGLVVEFKEFRFQCWADDFGVQGGRVCSVFSLALNPKLQRFGPTAHRTMMPRH